MRETVELACRMGQLEALLKGYPEFNPDQPRGDDGRWAGGGGAAMARKPRGEMTAESRARARSRDRERRRAREDKRIRETSKALDRIEQGLKNKTTTPDQAVKDAADRIQKEADDLRSGQAGLDEAKKTLDWLGIAIRGIELVVAMKIGGLIGGPWGEVAGALFIAGTWIYEWYDNRRKRLAEGGRRS